MTTIEAKQTRKSIASSRHRVFGIGRLKPAISVGFLIALSACMAPGPSESFTRTMDVQAAPSAVWEMIGPFCSIQDWHPVVGTCEEDGNTPPTRTIVTADGQATFVELQTARDDGEHSYSYTILSSPLPLTDYTATISVDDNGSGMSTITWTSVYDANEGHEQDVIDALTGVYESGLAAIAASVAE